MSSSNPPAGLFHLPDEWEWADVASASSLGSKQVFPRQQPHREFNYVALENIEQGTGRLVTFEPTMGSEIGSNKYTFGPEHVLFGKLRPYLRKVWVPEFEGISATDLMPIRPDPERLDRKFLARWLLSPYVHEYVVSRQTGVKMPRLRTGDLGALPIPLPPLPEQQRLVEKIERLLEQSRTAREALDRIPPLLKRFRQAVLAKAFRGELTERDPKDEPASVLLERIREERRRKWEEDLRARGKDPRRAKYVEPEPPETSGLPEPPEGWAWASLGQVVDFLDHQRIPVNEKEREKRKGPYPYYGANGQVGWIDDFLFDEDLVLLAEDGGFFDDPSRADAYVVRGKCWVNNHAHVLRPLGGCPPELLAEALNTFDLMPHVSGTTRLKLTQGKARGIPIPMPPLGEQRRIAARIGSLFAEITSIDKAVANTSAYAAQVDQAVLARAFRGEL